MAQNHDHNGLYVAIEGLDGAGTTTLARKLASRIDNAVCTAEPYDQIWTGEAVREALSDDTAPTTDLFLFLADRSEHLERLVKPALEDGAVVVSDRSAASTYAYQAHRLSEQGVDVNGDPWTWFDMMYEPWDVKPDVTLYLDVSVETALGRCDGDEKYEKRKFLEHVKNNYTSYGGRTEPGRWVTLDAERSADEVADEAMDALAWDLGVAGEPAVAPEVPADD